jgi:hypothetical protein
MVFGEEHFPAILIDDDPEAVDFARELVRESKLRIRMIEARNRGGACGSVAMSFAFISGKPRVQVHRAKHVNVIEWADREELRPRIVIKSYRYKRQVIELGKLVEKNYYYARRWDETTETVWDPIPEEIAKTESWDKLVRSITVEHNFGFVPLYIAQNRPDSESEDGECDYDGFEDDIDEVNRLVSATSKGTVANVDPTLVVKMDPALNNGSIRKGSENAIYSPNGAEYLELRGDSIKTAIGLAKDIMQWIRDVSGVVIANPEEISSASKSAAALKMLYQPMLAEADIYREQYGQLLVEMVRGMLRASRRVATAPGQIEITSDGQVVQQRPTVLLNDRVESKEDGSIQLVRRTPGSSERVSLEWPPYFPATPADRDLAVTTLNKAKGQLLSDQTAVRVAAPLFGVQDPEAELEAIELEKLERSKAFGLGAPPLNLQGEGEESDEAEDDESGDGDDA